MELEYDDGVLNDTIDATYIIHYVKQTDRYKNIMYQLSKIRPTNKIYILLNQGYKYCKKKLVEQKPKYDINHCNKTIFEHSRDKNYKNIMILEDDFDFNIKRFSDPKTLKNINSFINEHQEQPLIYSLGSIPIVSFPLFFSHTLYSVVASGAHCMIYNSKFRDKFLATNFLDIKDDWDSYTRPRYNYSEPLCYQLYNDTENNNIEIKESFILYFARCIGDLLNLNNKPEPGHSILYKIFIILPFLLLFFLIFIILKIIN